MAKRRRNKQLIIILIMICVVVGVGFTLYKINKNNQKNMIVRVADREKTRIQVGEKKLLVEVVSSPASITQGLSGRSSIGADGMLFIFDKKRIVTFWMKEMKFDIDIIFIADGVVQKISENTPKPSPDTTLEQLPLYSSEVPVNAVLELPAGTAQKINLSVGDAVEVPQVE